MTLDIRHLSHAFSAPHSPPLEVLHDISLSLKEGEITALIGPSGCGKTTLLECIAGLLKPDEGDILLNGAPLAGTCGHVSYMTQADVMLPWRDVIANITLPLEIAGHRKKSARAHALALLQQFKLEQFASFDPRALSGGMRQRVALARTTAAGKRLWLLDEPFAKLDALTRRDIWKWFLASWEIARPAVLFVTHDRDEALLLADRVMVLSSRPGRILKEITLPQSRQSIPNLAITTACLDLKEELFALLGIN